MSRRSEFTAAEERARDEVLERLRRVIVEGEKVPMASGGEVSPFEGVCGEFRFQFEGEDDLLRLCITRRDGQELGLREARDVVAWLLPELKPGLIWVRPGRRSHSFHLSHEDLLS